MMHEDAGANLSELSPGRRRYGRTLSTEPAGEGWYEDLDEARAFARALYEGETLIGERAVFAFLDNPKPWSEHRDEWIARGEPDAWPVAKVLRPK